MAGPRNTPDVDKVSVGTPNPYGPYAQAQALAGLAGTIGAVLFLGLVFCPRAWIGAAMRRHGAGLPDFPGTSGKLARHLLGQAGLQNVKVERVQAGDHCSSADKPVRLSQSNPDGNSVTAVAVAGHEVGHAPQDAQG